jgi:CheY-like chemotaxis protein
MSDDLNKETSFKSAAEEASIAEWRAKTVGSDQLLVRMNHGIRSAVNVILGMTDIIRESELNPSLHRSVNVVRTSAENLLKDSADIIDLTRAELGNLQLSSKSFGLQETLQQAMDLMSILASCKRVTLKFHISRQTPHVLIGDPARLNQILITLVRAAICRLDQGEISVSVERDLGYTEGMKINFSVADNGIRVPHETIGRVLSGDPEQDVAVLGGSEVSLVLARRLAKMMGGDLWAQVEPRIGNVLHFSVTLREAPMTGFAKSDKEVAQGHNGNGALKILVADDSKDTLLLIRAYLKDVPWEIESAEDGRIASEMAISKVYNLILMDLDMPEMDGYAATRQIRSSECLRQISAVPIVALTAHSEAEAALKSIEAGCTAHVTKPIRRAALIEIIRRYADDTHKHSVSR